MIERIRNHILQAQLNLSLANELLKELEKPEINLQAKFVDGNIVAEWEPFESNDVDLYYYAEKRHTEWQHSVNKYNDLHNNPFDSTTGKRVIKVTDMDNVWRLKIVSNGKDSNVVTVSQEPNVGTPEPYKIHTTLWDEINHPFDTVRSRNYNELREAIKTDKLITHSLSHIWYHKDTLKPDNQWRSILNNLKKEIKDVDSSRIELFLQDEPMGKDVWGDSDKEKIQNLNRLIQMAREILPDIRIGMSFTRGAYQRKPIPEGLDFYVCPMYLFFRRDLEEYGKGYFAIETQQDFIEQFSEEIKQIRKVIGNNDLYLIGQGFENLGDKNDRVFMRRWRKPPFWYPEVFYNESQKHNIKAIWWWLLYSNESKKLKGLEDMPDLLKSIQDEYEKYI